MIKELKMEVLSHGENMTLPKYATSGSAGMDLKAAISDDIVVRPMCIELVPTGLIFEIPEGHEGQIRPRSGLALNYGITVLNAPGTIDCDYRGEVKILLINLGKEDFWIKPAMRIAQLVIAKYEQFMPVIKNGLISTKRGTGGFGSSGV